MARNSRRVFVGVFDSEEAILLATQEAREAGHGILDVYTPFPVHGMDEAMGLRRSILPRLCFAFGAAGLLFALLFQWWVSVFDWPMNVGGKSFHASPALIPVAFEFMVLCAGLGVVASFFRLRRMFPGKRPVIEGMGATNDRFLLALRESEGDGGIDQLNRFLKSRGAKSVREVDLA